MCDKSIFVFGSKIFEEQPKRDAITTLPLEIAWKIFSYLDDGSLRVVYHVNSTWSRIVSSNKLLRKRLDFFELAVRLGSKKLAKFHRRNMTRIRREKKNYVTSGEDIDNLQKTENAPGFKRRGDNMPFRVKRFKLF